MSSDGEWAGMEKISTTLCCSHVHDGNKTLLIKIINIKGHFVRITQVQREKLVANLSVPGFVAISLDGARVA